MSPLVGPLLSIVLEVFKRRRFIRDEVVPLVASAEGLLQKGDARVNTAARREWVVSQLRARAGITESEARLLTETGVRLFKKLEAKRLTRLEKKAAKRAAKKRKRS